MAGGGGSAGPVGAVGDILGGAISMGGGIFGMVQAGNVKAQQEALLNKQKNLYYNFQLPTMQKKNMQTFGQFQAQTALSGAAVNSFGAQAGQAQEAQDLSNTLNLQNQQQQINFQAQDNKINNNYASSMLQGATSTAQGAVSMGTGIAGLAI